MPQPLDKKLLLNRSTLKRLRQAGLGSLAEGFADINKAREFALWCRSSGAEVYLLVLLTAAMRHMARQGLESLQLQPGADSVALAGRSHALPELGKAYRTFLYCYPRAELAPAEGPGTAPTENLSRRRLLAEIFILEVLIDNPAALSLRELFDDGEFSSGFDYHALIERLTTLSGRLQGHGPKAQSLPEMLRAPLRAAPDSLAGQVSYIVRNWAPWLPEDLLMELQIARAIEAEESRPRLSGPGPAPQPLFGAGDGSDEAAAFTADVDWMASSILLAKSVHVWLDQLGSRYQRPITSLADIPDEELASLARQGFNALWLIGIWERSTASRRIKQLCGNPEAEASAYALYAYRVAGDLGGESALQDLEQRCRNHGIRLACDVVPNHTGIDSELLINHPDWFIQTDHPPYPAYRFSGPDLCNQEGVSIRIEDGYWDHSDAAVVCEYHEHDSGRRRYIYHGNDGTHMPWNDTAQLNFLLPDVRRAMSDLIVDIARRFNLIRFDAAMTLARKHFRRLWFPPPGGSAGVPSRSSFYMSDSDFDQAFPVEFWREVVDRINHEAPDTLLIAEAFWLMESYFVRNLGMHRVYNSAFMNLLKNEENAKYRKIIKDILAYNPEILKRYVNFMNNPDEATAAEQFGKGDKYFGVATLLATLPGLPMFGHGQVEGYREKYGMEYRRAYWGEVPDSGLIAHHEKQIFPLLRIRQLFAGVENFAFYDFTTGFGIDENVFAFSNGPTGRKALVVYNNAPNGSEGRLHMAAPKASPEQEGLAHDMPPLWQQLGLDQAHGQFCRFRSLQGMEHLHEVSSLSTGLELRLNGYEYRVLHDFQLLDDADGFWRQLFLRLQARPVQDLDREMLQMRYQPLWQAFTGLLDPGRLLVLCAGIAAVPQPAPVKALCAGLDGELAELVAAVRISLGSNDEPADDFLEPAGPWIALRDWLADLPAETLPGSLLAGLWFGTRKQAGLGVPLLSWLLLHRLGERLGLTDDLAVLECLRRFGLDHAWQESSVTADRQRDLEVASLLMRTTALEPHPATCDGAFAQLCRDPGNAGLLGINRHAGETWFAREGMAALAGAVALQAAIMQLPGCIRGVSGQAPAADVAESLRQRLARAAATGYRLDKFLALG